MSAVQILVEGQHVPAWWDTHLLSAALMLGISYEEALEKRKLPTSDPSRLEIERYRRQAKINSFLAPAVQKWGEK